MKRCLGAVLTAGLVAVATPEAVHGQGIFVGGGATVPVGDYADYAGTGWMGFAGVLAPLGTSGASIGAEAFYGSNGHDTDGDKTNLYGALALIGFSFGGEDATVTPFVFGGLGWMAHAFKSESTPSAEGTTNGAGVGGGGGVSFPLDGARGMLAGSFNSGLGDLDGTTWVGISAAVQFLLGGG